MKRKQAVDLLRHAQAELSERYHIASLTLFGSVARDEARQDSDVDILVEFSQPVGLFHFIGLQQCLDEEILYVVVARLARPSILAITPKASRNNYSFFFQNSVHAS